MTNKCIVSLNIGFTYNFAILWFDRVPLENMRLQEERRKRGGKHIRDKQKRRMGRKMEVKVGTLNVGTMTVKGRELAEMTVKRKVDILCVQETKWKGRRARNIGDGCKIVYHGEDGRRNGVGVILSEGYIGRVL